MRKTSLIILSILIFFSVEAQRIDKQVVENNKFAIEMLKTIGNEKENTFVSPVSVSIAMSMAYVGAEKKTKDEIAKVMHFPQDVEKLNKSNNILIRTLSKTHDKKKYNVQLANSLWAQRDFNFLHNYFTTIENSYRTPLNMVDFKDAKNREASRKKINDWTSSKTNNKVNDILSEDDLDSETRLVLVNAIYFMAEWDSKFKKEATKESKFYGLGGKEKVDFMNKSFRTKYTENDDVQYVELPYNGRRTSMIIVMPKDKKAISKYISGFDNSKLSDLGNKAKYSQVVLSLPKFKIDYRLDLAEYLQNAGIKQAFTNNANFSNMVCRKQVKIDKVIHQAFVAIDENGTEAAAATAVVMSRVTSTGPAKEKFDFTVNKPFIFFIKNNETGSILFSGRINNIEK